VKTIGGILCNLVLLALCVAAGRASAPAPPSRPWVTIEGSVDTSGRNYTWMVTNHHRSPIERLEFPHYGAALFFGPEGWTTDCTNLMHVTRDDGVCTTEADQPEQRITEGRVAEVRMQVHARDARGVPGSVRVRFADGTEKEVTGVLVPQRESLGDRYVPLVGLGAIFIVFLLISAKRRKAKPTPSESNIRETDHPRRG
jgi:hypothetical protein